MSGSSARGDAFIQAEPNPVPEAIAAGTTTLSWSTGSEASGWVYVTDGAGEERLFARMAAGRQEAHWIAAGVVYRFALYADEDRTQSLASVDVQMEREIPAQSTITPTPSSDEAQASSAKSQASIRADPNPIPVGPGLGTTTISWSTGNEAMGMVYLVAAGGEEILFAQGAEGSQRVNWIKRDVVYRFRLYEGDQKQVQLAATTITMGNEPWEVARDVAFLAGLAAIPVGLVAGSVGLGRWCIGKLVKLRKQ